MAKIVNKYKNLYDSIFTELDDFKEDDIKLIENKNNIPDPSNYRISTMTMITGFNCNINLSVVDRYFEKDDIIISMVYGDKPVKSQNIKKKTNRPFFNQATIIVKLDPLKKINVKIFSNGIIQMTGVKKKSDGLEALNLILEKLHNTNGKVSISKLLLSQQIEILIEKLGYDRLPDYYYMFPDKLPKKSAWYKYNVTPEIIKEEKENFEKNKKEQKTKYGNTFTKDFDYKHILVNYSREKIEEIININRIYEDLITFYDNKDIDIYAESIEDKNRIKIQPIKIVLINSDFNINFKIKRNILHSILKDKYNIVSRYEPGIYPGVNNKYYWNKTTLGTENEGVCVCNGKCLGKGNGNGDGQCKKITIAAFQSGSIIITGANSIKQIDDSYSFINKIIKDNYELIQKIDSPFSEEDPDLLEKNKVKKYTRTTDIKYIDITKLKNKYNSEETLIKFYKLSNIKISL